MSDPAALKLLTARVAGLRQAMEAVMNSSTPDIGKWSAVNAFVVNYCDLAKHYVTLTGDKAVKVYDTSKLGSEGRLTWTRQKGLFDQIYADTLMLHMVLGATQTAPTGPIYNLFVSASSESWNGTPFQIESKRCVREYTSDSLTARFADLGEAAVADLKRAPCIFAYETGCDLPPKFGYIRDVIQRQGQARIEYELHEIDPFLSADDLEKMAFELDIGKLELYRTHWAVKEVNLPKELHAKGITLPSSVRDVTNAVDISKHVFDVALSFPGETRSLVENVSHELERRLGPNAYFYDNNYVSQLAQPSLDTLLQGIYSRAKLDVVFLSGDYQKKDWCGVEFRVIRDIIFGRENSRVMYVKIDEGVVEGVFRTDGYIDARRYGPAQIADFIAQRVQLLNHQSTSA